MKKTALCGTRGWPFEEDFADPHNEKIFKRELLRLEASLKLGAAANPEEILCFLHYPPLYAPTAAVRSSNCCISTV